jgi:hypothetical protein
MPAKAVLFIDHAYIFPGAPSKTVTEKRALGSYANMKETEKYKKYKPLLQGGPPTLVDLDGNFKSMDHYKKLFQSPPSFAAEAHQKFWPISTEIFGCHGNSFYVLLDFIAELLYTNGYGSSPKANLTRMRSNYSRLLYMNVGMAVNECRVNSIPVAQKIRA